MSQGGAPSNAINFLRAMQYLDNHRSKQIAEEWISYNSFCRCRRQFSECLDSGTSALLYHRDTENTEFGIVHHEMAPCGARFHFSGEFWERIGESKSYFFSRRTLQLTARARSAQPLDYRCKRFAQVAGHLGRHDNASVASVPLWLIDLNQVSESAIVSPLIQ